MVQFAFLFIFCFHFLAAMNGCHDKHGHATVSLTNEFHESRISGSCGNARQFSAVVKLFYIATYNVQEPLLHVP